MFYTKENENVKTQLHAAIDEFGQALMDQMGLFIQGTALPSDTLAYAQKHTIGAGTKKNKVFPHGWLHRIWRFKGNYRLIFSGIWGER